ncbi:MAG TPA: heparin lyase I family protein [Sphingomicrobium sp.]
MANGTAWNSKTPYAVCLGTTSDYVRFELRDTTNDHGANDASFKRRAEIGTNANYMNGTTYWMAYSVKAHVNGLNKSLGNTFDQFQDPLGSSPSISHRLVYCGGQACLLTTTRFDEDGAGGATVNRGQVPFTLDTPHDIVVQFQMGANGFEKTYLDGKLVSQYSGPIGTKVGDNYGLRIGTYGAPLSGMSIVQEYKNIAPFPSTASLSSRLTSSPAW